MKKRKRTANHERKYEACNSRTRKKMLECYNASKERNINLFRQHRVEKGRETETESLQKRERERETRVSKRVREKD